MTMIIMPQPYSLPPVFAILRRGDTVVMDPQ